MYFYTIHPDDQAAFQQLREQLVQRRRDLGYTSIGASTKIGRGEQFVYGLEKGLRDSPLLSSLQAWAGGLDCRIEFGLQDFWLYVHRDPEMLMLYRTSRQWGADKLMRLWLISALRQWRIKCGIEAEAAAAQLGVTPGAVRDWENDAGDPVLKRVMLVARTLETRLTMRLWTREQWCFEE
jgi:transcriptional regulator with XRE-family HTH domain